MIKKLVTSLLIVVAIISMNPIGVSAEIISNGNLKFDTLTGTITNYNGSDEDVIIPSEINGIIVNSIGDGVFANCNNLKTIEIPNSVSSIGARAFQRSNLTNIHISSNIQSIGEDAFGICDNLREINVDNDNPYYKSENGVLFNKNETEIIKYPEMKTDTKYEIPNSVTIVGYRAFGGCRNLTNINIPNSVISTKRYAFCGSGIQSIEIPRNVENMDADAFAKCSNLRSVIFEKESKLTRIESFTFERCSNLSSIEIPTSITKIDVDAFDFCSSLSNIKIPSSVTSLCISVIYNENTNPFYGCSNLKEINVDSNNQYYTSENGILFNKGRTKIISYPNGKPDTNYEIPNNVTSIATKGFSYCKNIKSVIIPDSVTDIGACAFDDCTSLENINIPSGTTSIKVGTFRNCSNLTNINIPSGITTIGSQAFDFCKNLASIDIPRSITSIDSGAFSNCSSLTNISIPNSVTTIGTFAFGRCTNLKSIKIPSSITSIQTRNFEKCDSLQKIYVESEDVKKLLLESNPDVKDKIVV